MVTNVVFLFNAVLHQMLGIWEYVSFIQWMYIKAVYWIEFDHEKAAEFFQCTIGT